MKIDNSTEFKVTNKYTLVAGIYSLDELTTYIEDPIGLWELVKSIMTDPIKVGNVIIDLLVKDKLYYSSILIDKVIARTCLYLAVCCFISKTEVCKSVINRLVISCDVSIYNSDAQENIRELLKEIVKTTINKYAGLFSRTAEELEII